MSSERYDCAVVGSGPNGLCAAITLAQAGRSVVVLEAGETIGGGARTAEITLPGFRHDLCSAIHPMGIGSPFLSSLPLADHGLEWVHPDAPLAHPLDDMPAAMLERDLDATAATLGTDGDTWCRWMGGWTGRWDDLAQDALGPLGIPRHPFLMASFGLSAMRSAIAVARRFDQVPAKALFAGLAAHSVLPLEQMPSAAIGLMLGIAGHAVGWPMPRGGSQAISDALASFLAHLGGTILTEHKVIHLDDVPTDGPVFFETSPHRVADIAADALPLRFRRTLQSFKYGPGVFKIDYALDGPIPWQDAACTRAGTVHLGGTLEEIAVSERAPWAGEHCEHPFVLVAQQSVFDPSRAPDGKHTGWAYCHVPNGSQKDMTEAIEGQLERFAPGFKDRVLARHAWSTHDIETHNPNCVGGDVNGGAPTLDQLFTRPTARAVPYSTPNPRIWMCSASTPPGGGIHGLCGHHAANTALARWPT